jgi:hypothetical protein
VPTKMIIFKTRRRVVAYDISHIAGTWDKSFEKCGIGNAVDKIKDFCWVSICEFQFQMSLNAPSKILMHLMVQKIQNYIYLLVLPAFNTVLYYVSYLATFCRKTFVHVKNHVIFAGSFSELYWTSVHQEYVK